jgi:PAS domain S-box-containing protein
MKIRTQVNISLIVFVILAAVITFSVFSSTNQLYEIQKKQLIIDNIEKSSFELYYLENDYLDHGGTIPVERWNAKYAALTGQLQELTLTDPSQQAVSNDLSDTQKELNTSFSNLVAVTAGVQGTKPTPASQELNEFYSSTLTGQTQKLISLSSQLSQLIKAEVLEVGQRTTLIISFSIAGLMVFVVLNYLVINRSVLRSISALHNGAERIGSGDLDTIIETGDDDELGDLSRAFNDMAQKRKRVEDALRESEEKYRTLVLSADTGIILQSASGKILTWNPAAERVFGISAEEVLGHVSTDRKWESVREDGSPFPASEHPSMVTLSTGLPVRNAIMGVTSNTGSFSWITINTTPLVREGESKPYAVVITFQDITARKQAEIVLKEREHAYRTLAENLPGIVYRVHVREDGRMQFFNAMVTVMTGYSPEELVRGKVCSIDSLILPEDRERVIAEVDVAIRENRPFRTEYRLTHKDGSIRFFVERGHPVLDDAGLLCIDGIIQDITDSKRAEEQRERLMNELARKNAELDRFTYTVSHDLKSPLVAIRAFASLLKDDLKSGNTGEAQNDIARISESAEKLERLITTLLELSRSGRNVDAPVSISFSDLAREAAGLLDATIRDRGVILVIPDNLPAVSGDRHRLLRMMTNLLDNAVKFMGDQKEPCVEVGIRTDAGTPVFFVRDNGMGIKIEYRPKLFGLFERFNPEIPGTGIGLATVKRIIEAHGGKIWVESDGEGKGTTVCFTLPVAGNN